MADSLDPSESVSLVQFALGGSDGLAQFFSPDQITQILSIQPIPTLAAAALVDSLIARFSISVDFSSGATAYKASQKIAALEKVAERLRASPGILPGGNDGTGVPDVSIWVGGESKSEEKSLHQNSDLVQPSFSIGQFDDRAGGGNTQAEDDFC